MLNEAQVSLTGYVATQPLARTLKTGVTTLAMRVAWTPRRRDRVTGEWADGTTSYVTVNCWRKLASNVAICVRKGDPVAIQGRLTVRPFTDKEGRPRIAVEIEASSVGHDLNLGVSQFGRLRPKTGMTAAEYAAAQEANGQVADGQVADSEAAYGEAAGGYTADGRTGDGQVAGGLHETGHGGGEGANAGSGWPDGEGGIPLPDEPDQAFLDESAIDEGGTQQLEAVGS
jgi:single-strand DNA-binding protein